MTTRRRRRYDCPVMVAGRENSRAAVLLHTAVAERMGLHATDAKALDLLLQQGPMSPSELCAWTGLRSASVTAMLDRLESRGLIERSRDPEDRRRVQVSATSSDVPMELIGPFLARLVDTLDDYTEAELAAIARFLSTGAQLALEHARALRADAEEG